MHVSPSWKNCKEFGYNENKKAVAEEAEGPEKKLNNVIEKAEWVIKDILEKEKHAMQLKRNCSRLPRLKSPAQSMNSPGHSQPSNSDHSGNCNQRLDHGLVVRKINSRISGRCL